MFFAIQAYKILDQFKNLEELSSRIVIIVIIIIIIITTIVIVIVPADAFIAIIFLKYLFCAYAYFSYIIPIIHESTSYFHRRKLRLKDVKSVLRVMWPVNAGHVSGINICSHFRSSDSFFHRSLLLLLRSSKA